MSALIIDRGGQIKENININPSTVNKIPPRSPLLLLVRKFQQKAVTTKLRIKSGTPNRMTTNMIHPKSMFPVIATPSKPAKRRKATSPPTTIIPQIKPMRHIHFLGPEKPDFLYVFQNTIEPPTRIIKKRICQVLIKTISHYFSTLKPGLECRYNQLVLHIGT